MNQYLVEYAQIGADDLRDAHRADHIGFRKGLGDAIRLAGRLMNEAGDATGSVIIIEAENEAAAKAAAAQDPYVGLGVFEVTNVRRMHIAAMKPKG